MKILVYNENEKSRLVVGQLLKELSFSVILADSEEKLFEELLYDVNSSEKTSNNKIFITNMENEKVQVDIDDYYTILKDLIKNNDTVGMRRTLASIIGTFKGRVE